MWKGVDLNHLPTWDTPRRVYASAGAPAHMPLPVKDWVALFATDCWDPHLGTKKPKRVGVCDNSAML